MNTNVLFIAYHAASFPIMESQGFAYMRGLSKKDIRYFLITFETKETLLDSKRRVSELGIPIEWKYLTYHRWPRFLVTCFDIACGVALTVFMLRKNKIKVVHARGFIPALIAFFPAKALKVKLFFDTRGLLADKYAGGGLIAKKSATYKLMKWCEEMLLRKADYFTVETFRHFEVIRSAYKGISKKIEVIPCCVDLNKFDYSSHLKKSSGVTSFSLIYLGKVGTWYLMEEMLDFYKLLSENIPYSNFSFFTDSEGGPIYLSARKKEIDCSRITVRSLESCDVPSFLSVADAGIFFINPYKRYNSSPIKFGEYLACGLPVIANSGIGDCDEIIMKERVGVIVSDFSKNAYETAIEQLKNLLSDKSELKARCRVAAQKHLSLETGVRRYRDIYMRLSEK